MTFMTGAAAVLEHVAMTRHRWVLPATGTPQEQHAGRFMGEIEELPVAVRHC